MHTSAGVHQKSSVDEQGDRLDSIPMRILLAIAAFPLLTTFAPLALFSKPVPPPQSLLSFEPVPLDGRDVRRRRLGRLVYLGGWALRSNDHRFGGISAMHIEGGSVTALSDAGSVIRFAIGAPGASIIELPQGPGKSSRKGDRDSEAMAVHGPHAWVAFERSDEVWRYRRSDWTGLSSAAPPAMKRWPSNSGSEAMLRLADGRFLIFSEGQERDDGTTEVLLFSGDPAEPGTEARVLGYRAPQGYKSTDAAMLPDGRMLVLNRRVSVTHGVSAKLVLLPGLGSKPAEILSGVEIAHLEAPLTVDNMEALSVTREAGRTIVWMASDDNFIPLQRSLLLKFALEE